MQGTIKGIDGNYIWLYVESPIEMPIGQDVDVDIKKHREKRSLNANSYFHVLCDKLRKVLNISMAACKNELITSYGQILYINDEPQMIKSNIPPEIMREVEVDGSMGMHFKQVFVPDADAYWYRVYRGSRSYNTAEMAMLIDGTIGECKLQGIETLTPDELLKLEGYEKYSHRY